MKIHYLPNVQVLRTACGVKVKSIRHGSAGITSRSTRIEEVTCKRCIQSVIKWEKGRIKKLQRLLRKIK